MKRIRVVNNKTRKSMIVTYAKGVIRLSLFGDNEPISFVGTEDEFDNEWSNPDFYVDGENEIEEI